MISSTVFAVDRIGIVHEGRLIEQADRDELAARARAYVGQMFTAQEREAAILAADLERYFLARTAGADPVLEVARRGHPGQPGAL